MVTQHTQVLELGTKVIDGGAFLLSPGMITKTQVILGQKESGLTYFAGVLEEELAEALFRGGTMEEIIGEATDCGAVAMMSADSSKMVNDAS